MARRDRTPKFYKIPEKPSKRSASQKLPEPPLDSESTPLPDPTTFHEALQRIRKSRYYYPYGEYNARPILTAEEYNALPSAQQSLAKPCSSFDVRNCVSNDYPHYEAGNRRPTERVLSLIIENLQCSPAEQALLTSLYPAKPLHSASQTPEPGTLHPWAQALKRFRHKQGLKLKEMADKADCSVSALSFIETGRTVRETAMLKVIQALGFATADDFLQAEAALPACESTPNAYAVPINPDHAAAFKRFRLKSSLSLAEVGERIGYASPTTAHNIEKGNASEQQFLDAIAAFGFSSPDAFLAAEAALPGNAALHAGRLPPGRSPGFHR